MCGATCCHIDFISTMFKEAAGFHCAHGLTMCSAFLAFPSVALQFPAGFTAGRSKPPYGTCPSRLSEDGQELCSCLQMAKSGTPWAKLPGQSEAAASIRPSSVPAWTAPPPPSAPQKHGPPPPPPPRNSKPAAAGQATTNTTRPSSQGPQRQPSSGSADGAAPEQRGLQPQPQSGGLPQGSSSLFSQSIVPPLAHARQPAAGSGKDGKGVQAPPSRVSHYISLCTRRSGHHAKALCRCSVQLRILYP